MTEDIEYVTIQIPAENGNGTIDWEIEAPTPEQLLVFASAMAEPDKLPAALLSLLENVLTVDQFSQIRHRLVARRSDPARLTMQHLIDLIGELMEAVTDFPTQPDSDSPASPGRIGTRSTGRVRSSVSTQSGSQRAAS